MFKISKFFFKIILCLIVIVVLIFVYARYIEPYRLVSTELTFENKHITKDAGDVTIAVFSDTHFNDSGNYTFENFEKVINTINDRDPDIILFLGDLIDDYGKYQGDTASISGAFSKLSARLGKFAVYGNHDHGGGAHKVYKEIMENGGFIVFENEFIEFEDIKLRLIGLDDFVLGRGDTSVVGESAKPGWFNMVFCHVPDIIDEILDYNIDFMVAGHTHGGQINFGQVNNARYREIFFPPYGRNYIRGSYVFENGANTTLYVTSGVASTILPLRFMAPPEVTIITITPQPVS